MPIRYMKTRVVVILILLIAALVLAVFVHEREPEEREFRGMFVIHERGIYGHLYQTYEKGNVIAEA